MNILVACEESQAVTEERAKIRSKTFPGVAAQWSGNAGGLNE